jgi:hypothetical protein
LTVRRAPLGAPGMGARLGVKVPIEPLLEGIDREEQLHQQESERFDESRTREGVWDGSLERTAAPNESELRSRPACLGERAKERDAQYPVEAGRYWERERREVLRLYPGRSSRVHFEW